MNILVTGGAGFIGSNLVEELVERGHDVMVIDNCSLGNEKNLSKVMKLIKFVKGDIRDFELMRKITKNIDIIFNEAAASSSPMFLKNLRDAVSVNVDGFINVLNAAKENSIKRVIYASTSSIYGNNKPPLHEDMQVYPVNFYSSTKLLNEHLAIMFGREYDLEAVGFRYLSVYGPREESKGIFANLVSQFLWAMQKDEQPVIYGDGTQTREFTYVKDVVEANILAMESKKKLLGEILNVGTGIPVSLNELVDILNKILGKNIKPKYIPNPVKGYISTQNSDTRKIQRTLGFSPKYTLEQGIRDTLSP